MPPTSFDPACTSQHTYIYSYSFEQYWLRVTQKSIMPNHYLFFLNTYCKKGLHLMVVTSFKQSELLVYLFPALVSIAILQYVSEVFCHIHLLFMSTTLPGCVAQSSNVSGYRCNARGCKFHPPPWYHTFVEIDYEIISIVILVPSTDSFKKGCCQLQAKVCARFTG